MAIPDAQSIMLPLLELAGDNQVHRVRDAVVWQGSVRKPEHGGLRRSFLSRRLGKHMEEHML